MILSSFECINWFAVILTVSVAIVTVNLLSIVLFIKNRSLRTRAMYLVINLTIVDMFVGGFSNFSLFHNILTYRCDIAKMNLSPELSTIIVIFYYSFPLTALTNLAVISLDRMHATIRPLRHRLIKNWVSGVTIAGVWVLATMFSTAILYLITMRKNGHIIFIYGNLTVVCVYLLSLFLTLALLLSFCVERILRTMVQPADKGN